MDPEELMEVCALRMEDYYRILYEHREQIESLVPRQYDQKSTNDICVLLEHRFGPGARAILESAGFRLNQDQRNDLMGVFVSLVAKSLRNHALDRETFKGMLRVCKSLQEAVNRYFSFFFSRNQLLLDAVDLYVKTSAFTYPHLASLTSISYLKLLLQRKILTWNSLFSGLENTLRRLSGQQNRQPPEVLPKVQKALHTLGMAELPADSNDLHLQYRLLMKTYHPDVNPAGLGICQRINEAYSFLLETSDFP